MDTQVGIVGAGPAGLLLAHLLGREGIDCVVLEARSREYVEHRVRAGVLEQGTVDVLTETGVADRLHREGMVHRGIELRFGGEGHRIALSDLAGGRAITVYGQQEVVKDLIAARLDAGGPLEFEAPATEIDPERGVIRYGDGGELRCAIVAGCDGFHGVARAAVPADALTVYEREYPFAWLGILARAAPSSEELIYTHHERGFALHSMRSPEVTRNYLQVAPGEDIEAWPDERIWEELQTRMALADGSFALNEGEVFEKGIAPMRSFVAEPMRHGRLVLAGDAAHIVPATGAKGLNLAVADVRVLARALAAYFAHGDESGLDTLLGALPAPGLARAALLVVDDGDAAPPDGRRVRGAPAALAARLRRALEGRGDDAGGELRRTGARGCLTGCSRAGACRRPSPTRRGCGRCWPPRRRWRGRAGRRSSRARSPAAQLDPRELGERAAESGNPVVPLVEALRGRRRAGGPPRGDEPGHPRHRADARRARRAGGRCARTSAARPTPPRGSRSEHRATPMIGRTLMQQAVPTTFGLKAAGWMRGLDAAGARLGGVPAAGAARRAGRHARRARAGGRRRATRPSSGSTSPCCRGTPSASRIAELAAGLGTACGAIAKAAGDVVLLAQTEVGEVREAAPGGSSSMPHKRNPVAAISARACARQAPGLVATLLACMEQEHERAAGAWHAEWAPLRALLVATGSAAVWLRTCLEGLQVDTERMRANLPEFDEGAVVSAAALVDRALSARPGA